MSKKSMMAMLASSGGGGAPPESGWTDFLPSGGSIIAYVSTSDGDDANDGLSALSPKLTIAAGQGLLRDGQPDHLRLKRGDTWTDENLFFNNFSGLSPTERIVVESYGDLADPRPLIKTGLQGGIVFNFAQTHNYYAFLDLDFVCHNRDPSDPTYDTGLPSFDDNAGINITSRGSYWHFEGCRFAWYASGVVCQTDTPALPISNVVVRRCVSMDSYVAGAGFCQGMYFFACPGLLVEENLVDRVNYLTGTTFDHGIYFQNGPAGTPTPVTCRNNVVTRGDGVQLRDGGVCTDNLFVKTWIAMQLGGGNDATVGGISVTAEDNVVLDGENNFTDNRGWGFYVLNVDGATPSSIARNILANNVSGSFPRPFHLDSAQVFDNLEPNKITDLTIEDNVVYNWGGGAFDFLGSAFTNFTVDNNVVRSHQNQEAWNNSVNGELADTTANGNRFWSALDDAATDIWDGTGLVSYAAWEAQLAAGAGNAHAEVSYNDPSRSVPRYNNEVLGGLATFDDFIANARDQQRGSWDSRYTAPAVNTWIRAGFVEV